MKTEKSHDLDAWKVDLEAPPRFQAEVWARIAARESARRSLWDVLDAFASRLNAAFLQPRFAAASVAMGLMLGIGAAWVHAQDANASASRQLESRYLQTINPLAHSGHSS